jgi:hypothetical protein
MISSMEARRASFQSRCDGGATLVAKHWLAMASLLSVVPSEAPQKLSLAVVAM